MRRVASAIAAVLVTTAALWFLLSPETLSALRSAMVQAHWPSLAAAMALSAAVQWLRAWRFSVMTDDTAKLPDGALVAIAFKLNFFNFVLPFRLGELSYPVLMRRAFGQPMLQAAGVLILARLLDLCTVSAILLLTAAWVGASDAPLSPSLVGALGTGLALLPFALAFVPLAQTAGPLRTATVAAGLVAMRSRTARLVVVLLSYAIWLTFGGLAILAARAVVDGFSAAPAMLGAAATNLAFALPINGIAGLGPAQAAWVLAVTRAGVGWNEAVVTALSVYAVVLTSALLGGAIAMASSGWAGRTAPSGADAVPRSGLNKPLV
jgi:hypothetical protein